MIELESPQIAPIEELGSYAKYEASPLPAGFGVTLGNALRRVMLSSLEGAAVTAIQIRDVYHEFTSIPGVKEDVTQIVLNVNYSIENTRVGQMTNYDKLTIELETDGTISPEEALGRAADILVRQFSLFANIGLVAVGTDRAATSVPQLPPNMLDMPIEELDLPMRAYNSLKRNNIVKVGQLLQLSDDDLLRMRNFGKKSLDEMKERLRMRGFILPDSEESSLGDDLEDVDEEEQFDDLPPEEA